MWNNWEVFQTIKINCRSDLFRCFSYLLLKYWHSWPARRLPDLACINSRWQGAEGAADLVFMPSSQSQMWDTLIHFLFTWVGSGWSAPLLCSIKWFSEGCKCGLYFWFYLQRLCEQRNSFICAAPLNIPWSPGLEVVKCMMEHLRKGFLKTWSSRSNCSRSKVASGDIPSCTISDNWNKVFIQGKEKWMIFWWHYKKYLSLLLYLCKPRILHVKCKHVHERVANLLMVFPLQLPIRLGCCTVVWERCTKNTLDHFHIFSDGMRSFNGEAVPLHYYMCVKDCYVR